MPGPGLQISIGADVAGAVRGLQDVGTAAKDTTQVLSQMSPAVAKAGESLGRIRTNAGQATTAFRTLNAAEGQTTPLLNQVGTAANKAGDALKKVVPGANQAGAALINVGRVAQDLPFGFIGIQNNLNPLLESFQRLKAETGSTKSAFAALGSSLIGPAGIGIALSVVSAAILIYQNGIAGFNKKTKEAKDSTDELAKALKNIALLESEAAGGVQGQVAEVTALAKAIGDANVPYEQRKRALQELKEINKSYFGDLKLEDEATGKLAKTIAEYNQALINSAVRKAFIDEIGNLGKTIADSDDAVRKARVARVQATNELVRAEKSAAANTGINARTGELTKSAAIAAERLIEARKKEADAIKALSIVNDNDTKVKEQSILLTNRLNEATLQGLKFKDLQTTGTKKASDALKEEIAALERLQKVLIDTKQDATDVSERLIGLKIKLVLRDGLKEGLSKEEIQQQIGALNKELQDVFNKQALRFESIAKIKITKLELAPLPENAESAIAKAVGVDKKITVKTDRELKIEFQGLAFVLREEQLKAAAESIRSTILTGAIDAFAGIGDTLGAAVAGIFNGEGVGNAIAAGGKAILGIIGGVLQEVGKQIIATSTLVIALKQALKSLFANPAAGIAVGLGLVALGGLLKNIKFDIPGFADGVTGFAGGLALVGEHGPELVRLPTGSDVIPNDRLGQFGSNGTIRVEGVISGQDILLSNQRTLRQQSRI